VPSPAKVPAAHQVLAILGHLGRQAGPVPAATVARELGLPRSTTYQLLATLAESGFVVHLADERRFSLGVAAYELATGYARQAPLQRVARVPLARLVDRTGHTAHLAVMHGHEVIYLIEERAPGRPPLVTDVGVRLPAHLTASGRAMLAALPAAQIRALFPQPEAFVTRHETGPRSLSALRRLLVETQGTRRRGRRGDARLRLHRCGRARPHAAPGGERGRHDAAAGARPGSARGGRRRGRPDRAGDRRAHQRPHPSTR
jgi:DNA-binding IclR family transcriptional regulator